MNTDLEPGPNAGDVDHANHGQKVPAEAFACLAVDAACTAPGGDA